MSLARAGVTVYFANVAPRVSDGASALYGIRAHALTPALLGPDGAGVSAYLGGVHHGDLTHRYRAVQALAQASADRSSRRRHRAVPTLRRSSGLHARTAGELRRAGSHPPGPMGRKEHTRKRSSALPQVQSISRRWDAPEGKAAQSGLRRRRLVTDHSSCTGDYPSPRLPLAPGTLSAIPPRYFRGCRAKTVAGGFRLRAARLARLWGIWDRR